MIDKNKLSQINNFIIGYKSIMIQTKKRKMLLEFLKPLTEAERNMVFSSTRLSWATRKKILNQLNNI